LNQNQL